MKIRNQIPEDLVPENENLDRLITVLDGMNAHKEYLVDRHVLYYKSLLIGETSWLKKRLEDYGFPTIPEDLPKQCMDAMLINARNIMSMKGSDRGLKYFLWCLTFGDVGIDWSNFYPIVDNLTLSEFTGKGFLLDSDPEYTDNVNYLLSEVEDLSFQILRVGIRSIYWNNPVVIKYINDNIRKFLNFTEDTFVFELSLSPGEYKRYEEPYWYFVNDGPNMDDSTDNIGSGIGSMIIGDDFIVT